jgi:hypothetical protein
MAYLLDSDIFIQAKNHHYRFNVCPGFWDWLIFAHSKGLIMSVKEVQKELIDRGDRLSLWCRNQKAMFVDTSGGKTYESFQLLATWVSEHYQVAAQNKFFKDADFVLVGYAHAYKHIVVTHEVPAKGFEVKIPNACDAMDVKCMNPFEMLAAEKVKFTFKPD